MPITVLKYKINALKCRTLGVTCGIYYNVHAQLSAGKWPTVCMAFNRGSAGSLQWSGFRENPTIFLTSIAH